MEWWWMEGGGGFYRGAKLISAMEIDWLLLLDIQIKSVLTISISDKLGQFLPSDRTIISHAQLKNEVVVSLMFWKESHFHEIFRWVQNALSSLHAFWVRVLTSPPLEYLSPCARSLNVSLGQVVTRLSVQTEVVGSTPGLRPEGWIVGASLVTSLPNESTDRG